MRRRASAVWLFVVLILPALALGLPDRSDAQVLDGINLTQPPIFLVFDPVGLSTIGWYYTPGFNYTLTSVETKFRGVPNASAVDRPVTLGVYTDRPAVGGVLLRAVTFQSNSARDVFFGLPFDPLPLTAGTRYFIGFINVNGLGLNITGCTGSAAQGQPPAFGTPQCAVDNPPPGVTNLGAWAADAGGATTGNFDVLIDPDFHQLFAQPVIRFLGQMARPPVDVLSRASAGPGGQPADGQSLNPRVSADGRFVVFESEARNLTTTCTTGIRQIYRRDRSTGDVVCVSSAGGGPGDGASSLPAISSDGRFVAYRSLATNLVACGNGQQSQVLRTDLASGTTVCASSAGGIAGNGASGAPAISADGRFVAYQSLAAGLNLAAGCGSGLQQVLRGDIDTGQTVCVSRAGGVAGDGASGAPAISADGRFVAYQSLATNLGAGCANGQQHVLRTDLDAGTTTCLSRVPGAVGNGPSVAPSISADGGVVAFESSATNLDPACTTGVRQIFVSRGGNALCFSLTQSGAPGNGPSSDPAVSGDGLVLSFATTATNLASGAGAALGAPLGAISQVGDFAQILRRSAAAGAAVNRLLSQSAGTAGNGASERPSLNRDGSVGAFQTTASNLVSDDTNGTDDVLLTTEQPPPATITTPANGAQFPLTAPTPVAFAWTAVAGATQYGFEFTGPDRAFANPNGTAPDSINGFGGAGGGLLIGGTSFSVLLDNSLPPGTYQVRVIGLSASGALVGSFGNAITLILGPVFFISPNARPAITAPAVGTQLVPGAQPTFTWTVVPGVAQYLFEVTGPNQGFANPNGVAPDPGALGSVVVPGTTLVAPVPTGLPSGTYQVRVIALTAAGQPIGTFSDAVTVVVP